MPRRIGGVLGLGAMTVTCALMSGAVGGCSSAPPSMASSVSSSSLATVATDSTLSADASAHEWRLSAWAKTRRASDVDGLESETPTDIATRRLASGVSFYASISSATSGSVTLDVLTGRSVPDYGIDLTNRHRHSQTLEPVSADIPVLLDAGDDASFPGALGDTADGTAVTLAEFGSLVKRDPTRFVEASNYLIHVAPGGRVSAIVRIVDPG